MNETETVLDRIRLFSLEMTMREKRLLNKCQEDPKDFGGQMAGLLWLIDRRKDASAQFDTYLDMTEQQILDGLLEKLPKAETKN